MLRFHSWSLSELILFNLRGLEEELSLNEDFRVGSGRIPAFPAWCGTHSTVQILSEERFAQCPNNFIENFLIWCFLIVPCNLALGTSRDWKSTN